MKTFSQCEPVQDTIADLDARSDKPHNLKQAKMHELLTRRLRIV